MLRRPLNHKSISGIYPSSSFPSSNRHRYNWEVGSYPLKSHYVSILGLANPQFSGPYPSASSLRKAWLQELILLQAGDVLLVRSPCGKSVSKAKNCRSLVLRKKSPLHAKYAKCNSSTDTVVRLRSLEEEKKKLWVAIFTKQQQL